MILLVMLAQLLTGLGCFDTLGKFAGAGVIVPITGFANSMVAPALEYKKEGIVPVSYTHLDVYKRQGEGVRVG